MCSSSTRGPTSSSDDDRKCRRDIGVALASSLAQPHSHSIGVQEELSSKDSSVPRAGCGSRLAQRPERRQRAAKRPIQPDELRVGCALRIPRHHLGLALCWAGVRHDGHASPSRGTEVARHLAQLLSCARVGGRGGRRRRRAAARRARAPAPFVGVAPAVRAVNVARGLRARPGRAVPIRVSAQRADSRVPSEACHRAPRSRRSG
eukprot:COSAG04_NODE_9709_length_838_cov_0.985115_1_plen_204_part_10